MCGINKQIEATSGKSISFRAVNRRVAGLPAEAYGEGGFESSPRSQSPRVVSEAQGIRTGASDYVPERSDALFITVMTTFPFLCPFSTYS